MQQSGTLGDEARVSIMWGKERGVSSYHRPLLLVLRCVHEGPGVSTRKLFCCGQEELGIATEVTALITTALYPAIIICCHWLPSNPNLLFAGVSFWTTRTGCVGAASDHQHLEAFTVAL